MLNLDTPSRTKDSPKKLSNEHSVIQEPIRMLQLL